jgi:hypothetical protein
MFKTKILLLPLNPDRDSSCHGTWRSSHGREITYDEIFSEPIGKLVISELPLKLIIVNLEKVEIQQWIPT